MLHDSDHEHYMLECVFQALTKRSDSDMSDMDKVNHHHHHHNP